MFSIRSSRKQLRILDFDIETVAAGFADPQWVPQRVTCIAWGWVDQKVVRHSTRLEGEFEMFSRFLEAYEQADMVTGHNLLRFDLPVLNADMIRTGMGQLPGKLVQDTMRLGRTKGLKKGQDNLALMFGVERKKLALDWQAWDNAYQWDSLIAGEEVSWDVVVKRCVSDVRQHKAMRQAMIDEGLMRAPIRWNP